MIRIALLLAMLLSLPLFTLGTAAFVISFNLALTVFVISRAA